MKRLFAILSILWITAGCELFEKEEKFSYASFPDIIKLGDNRIMCVFYNGWEHISLPKRGGNTEKGGRLMVTFSNDGGSSWEEPKVLVDTRYDDRDPSVIQLSNQDIICNYFSLGSDFNREKNQTKGTFIIRSTDNGFSWSSPYLISAEYNTSSPIRELSNGWLIVSLYGYDKEGLYPAVSISKDKGYTWNDPIRIKNENNYSYDEMDVVELENGLLLSVMRSSSENMGYSFSYDYGLTWLNSSDIGFPGHCPYLFKANDNTILLAHRIPSTSIRYSKDNGGNWSRNFYISGATGAYPSIVSLDSTNYLVAFYNEVEGNKKTELKFRSLEITETQILVEKKDKSQIIMKY